MASEQVGAIHYDISLDTANMIRQQRQIDAHLNKAGRSFDEFGRKGVSSLTDIARAAKAASAALAGIYIAKQALDTVYAMGAALFDASVRAERLRTLLDFASGGNGVEEIQFVRQVAHELGLELDSTARAYGGLQASARGTTLAGQGARDVFVAVAKASSVMGLSAEDTSAVLQALQQMVSKGVVSAEELRGQLGERLPGAFQIAARAMNVTTEQLGKMLEQGEIVSSDFLPKFAHQMEVELGNAAEKAANRLEANVNRMATAWDRFKAAVGDSGPSQAMSWAAGAAANDMTVFSEAVELAKKRGEGFFGQMGSGMVALSARSAGLQSINREFLTLEGQIRAATDEIARLNGVMETSGNRMGFYARGTVERALAVAKEDLARARQSQQALAGNSGAGGGRGSNSQLEDYQRRMAVQDEEATRRKAALAAVTEKLSGVNKDYFASLKAIQDSAAAGDISEQRRLELLRELAKKYGEKPKAVRPASQKSDPIGDMEEAWQKRFDDWRSRDLEARDAAEADQFVGPEMPPEVEERVRKVNDLLKQTPTAKLEETRDVMGELARRFGAGSISVQEFVESAQTHLGTLPENFEKKTDEMTEFAKQAASNIQDSLGSTLSSMLRGDFDNIGDMWRNLLLDMVAQAAAVQLNSYLFGSDFGKTGKVGGAVGDLIGLAGGFFGGGRSTGGPVDAGRMYRVNETGAPEMFTAANGAQYMLPTASGHVTPANQVGGQLQGGGGNVYNIQVAPGVTRNELYTAVQQGMNALEARILQSARRPGGALRSS